MSASKDPGVIAFEAAKRQRDAGKGRGDGVPPPVEGPPPEVDWNRAPFECLGVHGDLWWFVDAYGQVIGMKAERLAGQGPMTVLLGGDRDGWAEVHFPAHDREGFRRPGRFSPHAVHKAIAIRMQDAPFFDPALPRRGPGVWSEAGRVVVHTGNQVRFPDGTLRKPSFVRSGVAWIRAAAIVAPLDGRGEDDQPGTVALADEVEERFRRWNWEAPHSDRMLLGWLTLANLGALPSLRPLCMIDAQEGAGKTTLLRKIAALSPAAEMTDDTTEAGLRSKMQSRAAPIILDEFEGSERQEAVMGLLRRIVTGEGSRTLRGSPSQTSSVQEVVGTAIMGAIGAPVPNAAERSRILRLKLWPRAAGAAPFDETEMLGWSRTVAPALWGRILSVWPRIQDNAAILRPLLLDAGATVRGAQLVGLLVGAREAMTDDRPLDAARARDALEWAAGWIETEADQAHDTTAGRCLAHLMTFQVPLRPGESPTIAALLARVDKDGDTTEAARILAEIGLRVAPLPLGAGGANGLYVASGRRPGLQKVFAGTEWAGGRWATVLAQLRAFHGEAEYRAAVVKRRLRFSGENDRAEAVWIARQLMPAAGAAMEEARPDD